MKKIGINWFQKNRIHFLVWLIFITYETIIIGVAFKNFANPLVYVWHYGINILIFYFNAVYIVPWAVKKKFTFLLLGLSTLALVAIHFGLSYMADITLAKLNVATNRKFSFSTKYLLQCVFRCVYFLGFSFGYYLVNRYIQERNTSAEKEKQALIKSHKAEAALNKAQNAFLKAQINPHFLFNSLDFVYHSIDKESDKASEAILLLSRMMRYAVKTDETNEFIYLEDEIEQVENLLYLHQLRKDNEQPVQLICSSEVRTVKFIPLVLLTLVENVLKHGDLSSSEHEAAVMVYIDKQKLHIETDNLSGSHHYRDSTHIGLSNIRKRLEFAYDEVLFEHRMHKNGRFIVRLTIPLESLQVHEKPLLYVRDNDRQPSHASVGLTGTFG